MGLGLLALFAVNGDVVVFYVVLGLCLLLVRFAFDCVVLGWIYLSILLFIDSFVLCLIVVLMLV